MAEYIEREAAIAAAKHAWSKGLEPSQYIEVIPAADVVPLRHGRLGLPYCDEYYGSFADCKECGAYNILPCNYCRVCGAKMDLEV